MPFPLALIPALASLAGGAAGGATANEATEQGAANALITQRKGQRFAEDLLNESIARQEPFIQAGQAALPLSELAAQGGQEFRDTPIFRTRENIGLSELQGAIGGDEISGFARDRFDTGLASSEQAQNKARLSDLINISLGASGQAGQRGAQLANIAGNAAIQRGNIAGGAAQTSFEQRQNIINNQLEGLSGLPSFFAATRQGV